MKRQEKKREEFKYVADRIIRECQKNNYNIIGFSSSREKGLIPQKLLEMCRQKIAEKEIEVQVEELKSVCNYADALEEARSCDAVILVERFLYSTYKDISRTVDLLKNADIKLLGVVTIK